MVSLKILSYPINFLIPAAPYAGAYVGKWIGTVLLESFDWGVNEEVHCYDEALINSLIEAFIKDYPEYEEAYKKIIS